MKVNDFFDGVRIDFINFSSASVKIEGCIDYGVLNPDEKLSFNVGNNKSVSPTWVERKQRIKKLEDGSVYNGGAFEIELLFDKTNITYITATAVSKNGSRCLQLLPQEYTRLSDIRTSYARYRGVLYRRKGRNAIALYPYKKMRAVWFEICFLVGILFYWRLSNAKAALVGGYRDGGTLKRRIFNFIKPILIISESILMITRAFILLTMYYVSKKRINKPIWLISDRGMSAGDNGEALFRYIMKRDNYPAEVYFVISKKSKDYNRLRDIGPVLNQDSMKYKLLFLLANKIISSQADVEVTNPFIRQKNHFVDLYTFDFVFLQHGIIRHDLSDWLNRFNKNISLFITSAEVEYNSILNGAYYYEKDNILLSGLPRYDLLKSKPKAKLILAPTYRKELVRLDTNKNGARPYDPEFKKSSYRDFYNTLMNDARLIEALKNHNMTGELYLHPVFASQIKDFDSSDIFIAKDFPYDYKRALSEGSVMVTDYSSVVFDFAYLKKPVIYSQFDRDSFFDQHMYQTSDFFSDDDDGFGPVATSYDHVLKNIIETINTGCVMDDLYKKRVDNFFYKNDECNSERVYRAIVEG